MEMQKIILRPEHPYTLISMSNLASTYKSRGRLSEAEKLHVQAVETTKAVLGSEHPYTLASMSNLATTYKSQGRLPEAEKLDVQAVEIGKVVLGPEHPETLTSMWNLSHTWKLQGRDSDAFAMLEACVQLQNQQLGPNHPHTISATANLKEWQAPAHRPSLQCSPESSSGRGHESEKSTQARHSPVPEVHHRSNELNTERLQSLQLPLYQPQWPQTWDMIKKLFRRN
jgi:Tetratricopeptide repeat